MITTRRQSLVVTNELLNLLNLCKIYCIEASYYISIRLDNLILTLVFFISICM